MKFTCEYGRLTSAAAAAAKIVNEHSTVPVLGCALVSCADGRATVRSTDLEVSLEQAFPAVVAEPGATVLPVRFLSAYLAAGRGPGLKFSADDRRANFAAGGTACDLYATAAEDYPPEPSFEDGRSCRVSGPEFRKAVGRVALAASTDENRGPVLMSVMVDLDGGRVRMVATDGYRMALWASALDAPVDGTHRLLVPARALRAAAAHLAGDSLEISFGPGRPKHVRISDGESTLTARLVDGQYPDYEKVVPPSFSTRVVVGAPAFAAAMRQAELLGDRNAMVRLQVAGPTMLVTAHSDLLGAFSAHLPVEHSGESLDTALNARYLADILDAAGADDVLLRLNTPLTPIMLRFPQPEDAATGDEMVYVVMPLRP